MLHKTAWITCAPHNGPGWGAVKVEASGSEHDLDRARNNEGRGGNHGIGNRAANAAGKLRKCRPRRNGPPDACVHGWRIRTCDSLPKRQGVMRPPKKWNAGAFHENAESEETTEHLRVFRGCRGDSKKTLQQGRC